jgi:hypothetical protein
MITASSKEDIKRNEENWKKIHEILRDDAKNQLKNNKVLIPSNRKLLELLIAQREFVGNISSWMPSRAAQDELARLGLIEDGFVIGGFREWFADEVKELILHSEITKVIKLLNHIDPSVLGDLAGLSDKEYALVKAGKNWIVKFGNKIVLLNDNPRLYYLIKLLDNPDVEIHYGELIRFVKNKKNDPYRNVKKRMREEEIKRSLDNESVDELKRLYIAQIIAEAADTTEFESTIKTGNGIRKSGSPYFADSGDLHLGQSKIDSDKENQLAHKVVKHLSNSRKDIEKKGHRTLFLHLKTCIKSGKYSVYSPKLDSSVKNFDSWHIRF